MLMERARDPNKGETCDIHDIVPTHRTAPICSVLRKPAQVLCSSVDDQATVAARREQVSAVVFVGENAPIPPIVTHNALVPLHIRRREHQILARVLSHTHVSSGCKKGLKTRFGHVFRSGFETATLQF